MILPEIIIVPAIFGIPSAVIVIRMWFRHKEKMATLGARPAGARDAEERLTRIEDAINAMAIEMERVGEGQRFLTKLLADRAPAPSLPEGTRGEREPVNTPH